MSLVDDHIRRVKVSYRNATLTRIQDKYTSGHAHSNQPSHALNYTNKEKNLLHIRETKLTNFFVGEVPCSSHKEQEKQEEEEEEEEEEEKSFKFRNDFGNKTKDETFRPFFTSLRRLSDGVGKHNLQQVFVRIQPTQQWRCLAWLR
ncbi:hypothetical protein E2C01_018707 [Portunus trituberculatus]|uniref:Uncharacterized protein n=1 Tax=Portunus trituberculatus TaxID=210409 RepID=A0A5B7DWX6_PORTR|nr:hypothetical protein [Portunus trituberculatus]